MILFYHIIGREIAVGLFLSYTVPSHNKHIWVRPKRCAYNEKIYVLIMRSEGFRILGIVYTV